MICIDEIPLLPYNPLKYIFEDLKYIHTENTLWLEFGVWKGDSINYIAQFTNGKVYGFDSFNGLPEDWRKGYSKGCFNRNGNIPLILGNVVLVIGLFQDTLQNFIKTYNQKISFIHIDSDLYSSAKFVLNTLKKNIEDCIIEFDELLGYDGFEKGELLALQEFLNENAVDFEWIGKRNQRAAIKINKIHIKMI